MGLIHAGEAREQRQAKCREPRRNHRTASRGRRRPDARASGAGGARECSRDGRGVRVRFRASATTGARRNEAQAKRRGTRNHPRPAHQPPPDMETTRSSTEEQHGRTKDPTARQQPRGTRDRADERIDQEAEQNGNGTDRSKERSDHDDRQDAGGCGGNESKGSPGAVSGQQALLQEDHRPHSVGEPAHRRAFGESPDA